jgi:hypothetical protein
VLPLLLGLVLATGSPFADPDPAYPRVRGATALVRALIADTAARSETVRDLLARLAVTDVIVYVEQTGAADIPIARTKLVTASAGVRFLRIGIHAGVPFHDVPPVLAHELQHAVEIAEEPDVTDDEGMRRLYRRIGSTRGRDRFETDAAQDIEWRVRRELDRRLAR